MVYLLPLFTVLIWGGNSIINKLAAETIEPSAMSFYRWFTAMLLLTPFCLPTVLRQWPTIKPYLTKLAFLAMLGMVLNQSLGYYAGLTTTASNMSLITSLVPLLSVFISVPLLRKRISALSIVGGIRFVAPIHVGNLVEVSAKVIYTGTSSMHIAIDVQASDPKELKNQLTTHCIVIMVAVDEQGKPTPIPEWVPQTAEDIALRQSAIRLMNMRKEIGEEMEAHVKYLK
ncbi:hypothetical protein CCZ37_14255 [Vibrio qinghaiensis]|uniref:HotDog ACOT-type domain-containing protein n=1 Tax=Vibrio qinghaiensis TaxID=2025808 RepID=A0A223N1N4_9VIBR|nr:hypothetical protein CCZ37_14255 [Vibrio qinghaiensis]